MSTNEADLGEGSVDESLEDVEESQDHMEDGDESESSSSSDASIESQYNRVTAGQNLNQFVPAILRRAVVPFNAGTSVAPINIAPSPHYLPPPPMAQQDHEMGMSLINPNQGSLPSSHVGGVFPYQRMFNHGPQLPGDHQQLFNHGPPFPADYHHQGMRIGGPTNNNNYQLPTSYLPSDFRLDSASARTGYQATAGNGNIGSPMMRPQWANRHHQQNQLVLTDHSAPSYGIATSIAMQDLNSLHNMRMNWVDNLQPASHIHQVNWTPEAQNFVNPATPPNPRRPINGVYDPLYETMGLPVDPHLRMFLASRRDNAENDEDKLAFGLGL
ncbi:hypothetical protein JRO89_XS04G0033800 [Xanthoceras sorbifolium]|uniref:Uncharacterized protein n=1 Tax=Xanthoceras sorbifolium TaxID=99658 RepID=A0ABQ8I435_9ROSI|nr:hypothetical protein JRO89_XS04G0033800 [Xanthoceras sorbifolium]